MKTNKPIKWEDIKIGQDYYTEHTPGKKLTKLGNMKIRKYNENGTPHEFDMPIDVISKVKHYLWEDKIEFSDNFYVNFDAFLYHINIANGIDYKILFSEIKDIARQNKSE